MRARNQYALLAGRLAGQEARTVFFASPAGQGHVLIFFAQAAGHERVLILFAGQAGKERVLIFLRRQLAGGVYCFLWFPGLQNQYMGRVLIFGGF